MMRLDDYIDKDVAYFIGLLMGRGTIIDSDRQITIEFPHSALQVRGGSITYDQRVSIRLGLIDIRERLMELLESDILMVTKKQSVDLVIRFRRNNMMWRNILLLTNGKTSYPEFRVPSIFFDPQLEQDIKRQFIRGYADVAGNIRPSNNYMNLLNRVRLDVLNFPTNWEMPVQLCALLQVQLGIAVQNITWGHPNLGRGFREHQMNIFAEQFLPIGFSFEHKQAVLERLAAVDATHPHHTRYYQPCPGPFGRPAPTKLKDSHPQEHNAQKLPPELVGHHYDAYWQICETCGCRQSHLPEGFRMTRDADAIAETEVIHGDGDVAEE